MTPGVQSAGYSDEQISLYNTGMSDFARVLLSWQPFYTTIAPASATMVGPLLAALTFNRSRFDAHAISAARRTFANLLDVLLIQLLIASAGKNAWELPVKE